MSIIKPLGLSKIEALGGSSNNNKDVKNLLFHVVNPGESITKISELYNIFPSELKKYNKLTDDKTYIGQVLKINKKEIIKDAERKNNEKEIKKPIIKKSENLDNYTTEVQKFISDQNSLFAYENFKMRDRYYMDFGFTENLVMYDEDFKSDINFCMNAICWIEHHECYDTHEIDAIKNHFIYVNVFYVNKVGKVLLGKQIHLDFKTQSQKVPQGGFYSYEKKLLTPINKNKYDYLSKGKNLHSEIFIEKKYKFAIGGEIPINDNNRAYKQLMSASMRNIFGDTNHIYAAVGEKKEKLDEILDWISIAAIPVEIPLKFIKPIQGLLEIIAYASDVDSKTKIIDKFFDERGPIPLSPIYHDYYEKPDIFDGSGTPIGGYKQILRSSEKYEEDFIMEEILELLQEDIIKKK
ncbi:MULTISPECIES: LysM peptidoglycan-binding domain-containing protein [Chryseobacterium]|uniref:LysM repeat protein n=1 Tax=Chryseobacterium geocarposphaerae TaxID=1416776 RepID=A0ABU1LDP6_9FLAO|nr:MULTISPECIES: LysM peptidoglycan-binding domain-containing protein [Chryseobacterium]MDR6404842.1 LysM repeat protein [Chryseobacterium geocarposphaerae]MDR6697625.1 LysM repeat protein [Chryseobacterium ginsenosidimutans]